MFPHTPPTHSKLSNIFLNLRYLIEILQTFSIDTASALEAIPNHWKPTYKLWTLPRHRFYTQSHPKPSKTYKLWELMKILQMFPHTPLTHSRLLDNYCKIRTEPSQTIQNPPTLNTSKPNSVGLLMHSEPSQTIQNLWTLNTPSLTIPSFSRPRHGVPPFRLKPGASFGFIA